SRATANRKAFLVATIWTVFGLYGALFTARPYPHYLLQAAPSLSLLIGGLVAARRASWLPALPPSRRIPAYCAAGITFALLIAIYIPWPLRLMPGRIYGYYENFALYAMGQRSVASYNEFFDKR